MRYTLRTNDMNQALENLFNWDAFFSAPTESRTSYHRAGAMDVWESDKGFHMEVELPGLSEEEISLELLNRTLLLTAKETKVAETSDTDNDSEKSAEEKYYIKERRSLSFSRKFPLPESADPDKMEAKFTNGLLTVDIPRREEAQPRKITIN